jgi:hypothetical protein
MGGVYPLRRKPVGGWAATTLCDGGPSEGGRRAAPEWALERRIIIGWRGVVCSSQDRWMRVIEWTIVATDAASYPPRGIDAVCYPTGRADLFARAEWTRFTRRVESAGSPGDPAIRAGSPDAHVWSTERRGLLCLREQNGHQSARQHSTDAACRPLSRNALRAWRRGALFCKKMAWRGIAWMLPSMDAACRPT